MELKMTCDHCGKEIHFGDDFYYKICKDGMKHFCSEECYFSDKREAPYQGLASLKSTTQN